MGAKRAAAAALLTGATIAAGALAGAGTASADVKWCDGTAVQTCIELRTDHNGSYHELEGQAFILDELHDGMDFDVDATMVKVQVFEGGGWRDLAVKVERSWEPQFVNDHVNTRETSCSGPGTKLIRAVGWYRYRRTGGDVVAYEQMATKGRQLACQR